MLRLFTFESKEVRCYGTWDQPVWIAQDVCDCLELNNNRQALARLDNDEKDVISVDTPGGKQEMLAVNEPGLYTLVLGCRKPVAKKFKRWITHDVLPSIRKIGSYSINQEAKAKSPEEVGVPDKQISIHSPKEISEAIDSVLSIAGIDPKIIAGLAANEIGKAYPALKPHMEATKKLLPLPVEQELLTVTDLAKKYVAETGNSLSKNNTERGNAMSLNKLLISLGLQVQNPDGNPSYLPTDSGKPYSQIVLQEGKDSNKTCQQLRWYPKVLERLA